MAIYVKFRALTEPEEVFSPLLSPKSALQHPSKPEGMETS